MATAELPQVLSYDSRNSSCLIFSSNAQMCNSTLQGAQFMHKKMRNTKFVGDTLLVSSSLDGCTKKGLKEVIETQTAKIVTNGGRVTRGEEEEERLFVFLYSGSVCDITNRDTSRKSYSLVLNDFEEGNQDTHVTGKTVGEFISKSQLKKILIILDSPFADEFGLDLQKSLGSCEVVILTSQTANETPFYLEPLGCSTFIYFLGTILSKIQFVPGFFPLKSFFTKVRKCCEALSQLVTINNGEVLTTSPMTPNGKFVKIVKEVDSEIEKLQPEGEGSTDEATGDQVDYGGQFGTILRKYYKKRLFGSKVKVCIQAVNRVHAMMQGPLQTLSEQEVFTGKVVEAAVGAMMFSVATIQEGLHRKSIADSNIFLQSYIYVAGAIDTTDHEKVDVSNIELLKCAKEFYVKVLRENHYSTKEVDELVTHIENNTTPSICPFM